MKLEHIKILFLIMISVISNFSTVYASSQAEESMTGLIQVLKKDGKAENIYYGDYADGWNANLELTLNPKEWRLRLDEKEKHQRVMQYHRPNESDRNWTEVLKVIKMVGPMAKGVTPEVIEQRMKGRVDEISSSSNDVFYAGSAGDGDRFEMVRVLVQKDVVITVHYASTSITSDRKREIKSLLMSATIT